MLINKRLKEVSELIPNNNSFIDIGCDHAMLDIYLATNKEKNFKKIVASDKNEGPLKQASKNIKQKHLQDKIELRLGSGLDVYTPDINTVVISGMGGRNMIGIFKNNMDKLKAIDCIVLSPNNYQSDVKKFLTKTGFIIDEEVLVKENKFIYQIIRFIKGKKRYTKKEYFFGPKLLTKKDKLFYEYYNREQKSREILLDILPKNYYLKRFQIKKEIKLLQEELKES